MASRKSEVQQSQDAQSQGNGAKEYRRAALTTCSASLYVLHGDIVSHAYARWEGLETKPSQTTSVGNHDVLKKEAPPLSAEDFAIYRDKVVPAARALREALDSLSVAVNSTIVYNGVETPRKVKANGAGTNFDFTM